MFQVIKILYIHTAFWYDQEEAQAINAGRKGREGKIMKQNFTVSCLKESERSVEISELHSKVTDMTWKNVYG